MKKLLLLTMASMMTVFAMAVGRNDGSTKANAIDFDWDLGNVHEAGTKWYHVDLTPLYEEENPSLTLYVTNPSRDNSVEATLTATVAGETDTKHYTVSPHEHQIYSTNASVLVHLHQTEIYLTLTTDGDVYLSAKVFESSDLDETCKDAKVLKWDTEMTQTKGYAAWWKVDLTNIKDTVTYKKDAKVTITNIGTGSVNLKAGQSLDCPSSGLTKRNYTIPAGESIEDTIPQSMILSVYPDELYFSIENLEQPVKVKVEMVDQPVVPIIPGVGEMDAVKLTVNPADTTIQGTTIPAGQTLYAFSIAELNAIAKYEPEFTYHNASGAIANVTTKMAFERPAFGTSNASYTIADGEEEVVVYKKNMLDGMTGVDSIYLLTITDQPITFTARYKHVREGKACKTNIDFNWETGHIQEARTTQWYAVDISGPRNNVEDIVVHLVNLSASKAKIKASLAFSCPYIDLQEITHSIEANSEDARTIRYSTYAMMSDTVWIGLETNQELKFWVGTKPAQTKEPDHACEKAETFNWDEGVVLQKDTTVWYKLNMTEVREKAAKFPTVVVENLSSDNAVKITAELSLECPDSIENQKRSLTIAAGDSYSKKLSRNLFENIVQDEIYLCVRSTQAISIQIRLTEEAPGASCGSAIPFNWVSGNTQAANTSLWYVADLSNVMRDGNDVVLHLENRDNAESKVTVAQSYICPDDNPSYQDITLAAKQTKQYNIKNGTFDMAGDSVVYFQVEANTALRFWVDTLLVQPYDTISGEGLTLVPLKWDSVYTLDADTTWFVILPSELDKVRNLEDKKKPVSHLTNLGSTEAQIKTETAYGFPIVKSMKEAVITLAGNQHKTDTVPLGTFEQYLQKDSILFRVTRPNLGDGTFQFRAELIKAWNGNTRKEALPIMLNKTFTQAANTEMWYKLKTADLKKPDLYNKIMHVAAKNAGVGDTEVRIEVYDGFKSDVDLFMNRGKKVLKKGESKSHNVPAQALYGMGNVELYIKVKTTDSLVFSTKFNGEYAAQAADPDQQNAKLVVPNVEYTIPGDNQYHWYQVCLPYLQKNYKYTEAACLTYELNGKATIEGTATFQDTMTYAMPVRKRTINKSGGAHKGTQLISKLIEKGAKKAGYTISLDETQPAYIDSLLHRFVTKDSVTLYVRFKTDNEIKFNVQLQQTTGDDCLNAMNFDWEHGNVNPKDQQTWYMVHLDSTKIPVDKDIRLHVDNWSETESTNVSGGFSFKCGDKSIGNITKTIAPQDSLTRVLSRDFIAQSGWPEMIFFDYTSDQVTHLWIELIDKLPRDTARDTITVIVCAGTDTLGHIVNVDTIWRDTISDLKDTINATIYDSISLVYAYVLREPKLYAIEDIAADSMPVIKRDQVLDVTKAEQWLTKHYAADKNDTIMAVTGFTWNYSTDGLTYNALPTTPIRSEWINLQYVLTLECGDQLDTLYMNTARDTLDTTVCNYYKWEDSVYIKSTEPIDSVIYLGGALKADSIAYLKLTVNKPYNDTLELVSKYGDRLLMINRTLFNTLLEDTLDLIDDTILVSWYRVANPTDEFLGYGYYYCKPNGDVLDPGTYFAVVEIPPTGGAPCGSKGSTVPYTVKGGAAAPALVPSLARPGQNVQVVNLDPEQTTVIRLFTTEGVLQNAYTVSGQTSFTIKASDAHGFYLVELSNDSMKTTLRYIVK